MDSPVVPETGDDPSRLPPGLPRISDYWPDAPHRLGPPADHYELPGTDPRRLSAPPPVRVDPGIEPDLAIKRDYKPVILLLAVLLLVGGGVFAVVSRLRVPASDDSIDSLPAPPLPVPSAAVPPTSPPVSIGTSPPPSPTAAPTSAAAPGGAEKTTPPPAVPAAATLELADGVAQLQVLVGDIGDDVVRVSVGEDSTIRARAAVDDDRVTVSVEPNGRRNGSASLEIRLSEKVRWSFTMRGGVSTARVDLSGGQAGHIVLIGGAATMDLVLPTQRDAIGIVERGGLGTWRIVTDREVPVRAFFRRGAGSVTVYGDTDDGVAPAAVIRSGRGDDGIRLASEHGVGALTVQSR
ncbi:hypothetical protein GCM10010168_48720 [Actinoplanes ianthinogenes]|uniref:Adhesin domain-containing protein n=1 Tax=Actinoplanes ianthinogenes TaxID=122358 RepID=A0ABM7LNK1_9ACTN|nr:hypothetical protein [Actinoplanes ianthinogenes]BCJ40829.1 hypothetical protein Aiant_14860 [Actinoplanes ianthinogenes]GGR24936.1 hypothetical protein GCM10010168_48720 [Actinoplanes ianthinogenes]